LQDSIFFQDRILNKDFRPKMEPGPITSINLPASTTSRTSPQSANEGQSFDKVLETATSKYSGPQSGPASALKPLEGPSPDISAISASEPLRAPPPSQAHVFAAYENNAKPSESAPSLSGFQKYKDDQLLRNPGGRSYHLDKKEVVENTYKESISGLVRKDLSDALGNVRKFFGNMLMGTTVLYRNDKNEIQEGHQRGLLETTRDFFKDLGSALSFGTWHPECAEAPKGFTNRLFYSASKLKDAVLGDILGGIPSCVNHMGKNIILSGLHLAEVLPDAATGSFEPGQKLTTTIFDNGHVMVEYLTDIIPTGDAWLRVHASSLKELKPPILYNLKMPEHFTGDARWEHVRNTPFRKTIETIGSLITDGLAIGLSGQTGCSSNRRHQIDN
jgi:hypothetical protein